MKEAGAQDADDAEGVARAAVGGEGADELDEGQGEGGAMRARAQAEAEAETEAAVAVAPAAAPAAPAADARDTHPLDAAAEDVPNADATANANAANAADRTTTDATAADGTTDGAAANPPDAAADAAGATTAAPDLGAWGALPWCSTFVPLGTWSGGERLIFSDPTGAPHQPLLLPIARAWSELFGPSRRLPLWLSFTPGAIFAVPLTAARAHPRAFYERALLNCGLGVGCDPIAGHAFERLWRYIFDPALS